MLRFHYAGKKKIPLSAVLVVPRGTGALKDREREPIWEKTSIFKKAGTKIQIYMRLLNKTRVVCHGLKNAPMENNKVKYML